MKPAATDQPPSKKPGVIGRISAFGHRLSRPTRAAIAVAVFLVLMVIVVWVAFWIDPNNVPWRHSMSLRRILTVIALVLILPLIVYQVIRLWLEGDLPKYPDIDFAWNAGLEELDKQGLSIESLPVFVIIGSSGDRFEKAMMDASEVEYRLRGIPDGTAALHWYADPRGIFLCLSTTSRLSALSTLQSKREEEDLDLAASSRQRELVDEPLLTTQESLEFGNRLEYVCGLLHRARQPAAPCNGILTVLTLSALQLTDSRIDEWEKVIRADLNLLQRVLQVRCPVVGLVIGMEKEQGFRELIRRVGSEHSGARLRRFGKGFDLNAVPSTEQLSSFAVHVSSVFEDWTYLLFRQPGALTRPGNRHLYALLCRVRLSFQSSLSRLLAKGFGHRPNSSAGDDPMMFAGCYFAATGETPDRQAFVRGVIDKLYDEQESLQWTGEAISESRRYARLSKIVWMLNGVCTTTLVTMLLRRLMLRN